MDASAAEARDTFARSIVPTQNVGAIGIKKRRSSDDGRRFFIAMQR